MKNEFTPGPWLAIVKDDEFEVIKDNGMVQNAYARQTICRDISQGYDKGKADARLIAAAPKMYAELVLLREQLRSSYAPGEYQMVKQQSIQRITELLAEATNQKEEAT